MKFLLIGGMKKLILILVALNISSWSYAQCCEIIDDSSEYQLSDANLHLLIGQELLLSNSFEFQRVNGYRGFLWDYEKSESRARNIYLPARIGSVYSSFDQLHERSFIVMDIIKRQDTMKEGTIYDKTYLKLQDQKSGDSLYYNYEKGFPFLVLSFYKRLKKQLMGKQYSLSEAEYIFLTELGTNAKINYEKDQSWTVTNLAVESTNGELAIAMSNDSGLQAMMLYRDFLAVNRIYGKSGNTLSKQFITEQGFSLLEKEIDYKPPTYPGGEEALMQFLVQHIHFPEWEKDHGIQGVAYVKFVVTETGALKDLQIANEVIGGPGLADEAIRVIRLMPKWQPALSDGKPIAVQYNLPVKFVLR